jgi:hypothetical protein
VEQQSRTSPISIVEAENFWRTGSDARAAAADSDAEPGTGQKMEAVSQPDGFAGQASTSCCAGADVPGVGRIHSADCPHAASPVDPRRASVAGEGPQPPRALLAGDAMEALLIRLIFGAKILTGKQMRVGSRRNCCECLASAELGDQVRHRHDCAVGEVAGTLEALEELGGKFGKEAAANVETERAGDGIRPRVGLAVLEHATALRTAAIVQMAPISGLTHQCLVCRSSVTGLDRLERDIVHASDCWVGNALAVLDAFGSEGGAR